MTPSRSPLAITPGGDGADTITNASVISSYQGSILGGYGKDTINFVSGTFAAYGGVIGGNQGADVIIFNSAGGNTTRIDAAEIGGGLQNDSIYLDGLDAFSTSTISGGDHNDTISVLTGAITDSSVNGNKMLTPSLSALLLLHAVQFLLDWVTTPLPLQVLALPHLQMWCR